MNNLLNFAAECEAKKMTTTSVLCVIVFFPQVCYGWVYFQNSSIKPDFLCCTGAMIQRRRHVFKVSSLKSRRWSKVHGAGRSHGWSGWEQREMIRDKQLIGSQWWATVKRLRPDVFSRSTCWLSSWTKLCQWGNQRIEAKCLSRNQPP